MRLRRNPRRTSQSSPKWEASRNSKWTSWRAPKRSASRAHSCRVKHRRANIVCTFDSGIFYMFKNKYFFRWRFRDWRNNDLRGWMERQSLCSCRRCFGWGKLIWIEIKLNYCYIDFIFVFQYLYDLLMNLLEEKGISNEFVQKLSDFSTSYEHSSYIGLLEGISKFTIDKK